ncbi:MAG: TIGR00730 family Rossman fold protein [Alphaproteobacteria bacterium]|nr:TIGR00730 family Rossman fold protein [Alphaproteobacteria bacterium]
MEDIKSVCVYCGSSSRSELVYQKAAFELGKELAAAGIQLVYGGGQLGLMGLVADGVINNGGRAIGFITRDLEHIEGGHSKLSELHIVDTMHTRKLKMSENADAFVILPGGFGTLDELFEILTWRQLEMHDKPLIIANINGYWDPLKALIHNVVEHRFARPLDEKLLLFVSTVEEIIPLLHQLPEPSVDVTSKYI